MRRREFVLGWAAAAGRGAAQPARPSILLLLADQWRGQALAAAGDTNLRTPHLDELARSGLLFRRAYTSNPVCSPARASLLTGRFPHACRVTANNIPLPLEEPTISQALAEAGYATGYIGKWHLDGPDAPGFVPPGPRRRGFDYWAAFNRGHRYFDSIYFGDGAEPVRGEGFEADYQTGLACDFIRRQAGRPWFLVVSWGPPHPPRTPPAPYSGWYDPERLRLRANVPAAKAAEARKALAGYYGLCSALDANVGRLVAALRASGTLEDTIIVFTSDHGDMLSSHGLEGKGVPFEEAVRIPLLVRYGRAIRGGVTSDMPISLVDLMPTLLSLAGVPVPAGVQGRDLSQQWVRGAGPRSESVYCQGRLGTPEEWRMVVRGLDKLVVDRELRVTHLFNLGQDPYERSNLAREPAFARTRDEMTAILRDWMQRLGDRILPSGLKLRG